MAAEMMKCRLFYDEPGGEHVRTELRELPEGEVCAACDEPLPAANPCARGRWTVSMTG